MDIKPYIPSYDTADGEVRVAQWLQAPPVAVLDVELTPEAEAQLAELAPALRLFPTVVQARQVRAPLLKNDLCLGCPAAASSSSSFFFLFLFFFFVFPFLPFNQALCDILRSDPRSVYRRNKCGDRPYWVRLVRATN